MAFVKGEEINISELTLEQKIAQMIMIRGNPSNAELAEIGIGGIFLDQEKTLESYTSIIQQYNNKSKIRLLIATDMEGYWNPFLWYESKPFGDMQNAKEAYYLGREHAKILGELGFNLDFSPVVEVDNNVWPGRSFRGNEKEVKGKISSYINGMQKLGILATAKHYPGGSMIKNPHWRFVKAKIKPSDLGYFNEAVKNNVSAIMVGHSIVEGAIDSKGKQSTISPEVVSTLRKDFNGLIITDDINMLGLRLSYLFKKDKLYVDLIKAGNDIILDSSKRTTPTTIKRGMKSIKKSVEKGEILEKRIDQSVKRILEAKGYTVTV